MINTRTAFAALAMIAASAPVHAAVTISTAATQNMNCQDGTCVPTASNAVLNVSDLQSALSQFGNVRVMTTGNSIEANNIVVRAPFASPDSTSLTLEAHKAITVNAAVSIGSGTAELELQSDTLDALYALSFGKKGHLTFGSPSDICGINGGIFTLVGSVQGLASAIVANPSGSYALANSYDASQDGTYLNSPVSTILQGSFNGLGNTISNLSIDNPSGLTNIGMFMELANTGVIDNVVLTGEKITISKGRGSLAGGLVAQNFGTLFGDRATGSIVQQKCCRKYGGYAGGLAGSNAGTITRSSAKESVHSIGTAGGLVASNNTGQISTSYAEGDINGRILAGGIVGENIYGGSINESHATGSVTVGGCGTYGCESDAGGLVAQNFEGSISKSYATGSVTGGDESSTGGLVGWDDEAGDVNNSYATGAVTGGTNSFVGGFIGNGGYEILNSAVENSYSTGAVTGGTGSLVGGFDGFGYRLTFTDCYWDTETSGTNQGSGGKNFDAITGLTTEQLESGLPTGFDPKIWAENPNINNGLPYLINNPPPK